MLRGALAAYLPQETEVGPGNAVIALSYLVSACSMVRWRHTAMVDREGACRCWHCAEQPGVRVLHGALAAYCHGRQGGGLRVLASTRATW